MGANINDMTRLLADRNKTIRLLTAERDRLAAALRNLNDAVGRLSLAPSAAASGVLVASICADAALAGQPDTGPLMAVSDSTAAPSHPSTVGVDVGPTREELAEMLRKTVEVHCRTDRFFCGTCSPARALLARMDGGK